MKTKQIFHGEVFVLSSISLAWFYLNTQALRRHANQHELTVIIELRGLPGFRLNLAKDAINQLRHQQGYTERKSVV